jgi:cellulose synthase/poly-beta-1,6-N-acetylglucosamine synthase-like glycosyltransferase
MAHGDDIVVVADNCTDDTADLCRNLGAIVIERIEPNIRGKGHALAFGMAHMPSLEKFDIVIIVDADSQFSPGAIARLKHSVFHHQRPVQARYEMLPPINANVGQRISAFAFRVKNHVRALGLMRIGGCCQLTGTGMAFPKEQLQRLSLDKSDLAEDMSMGIECTQKGFPPLYNPDAVISSPAPTSYQGQNSQRERWEQGHLSNLIKETPKLLSNGLARRNWQSISMAFDLAIPPLSLLCLYTAGLLLLTTATVYFSLNTSLLLLPSVLALTLIISVMVARQRFAKELLPFRDIAGVPAYVFRKIRIYIGFVFSPQKKWVRTDRHD